MRPIVHPSAVIGEGAKIGDGTIVGPHASVFGNVEIGERCVIGPGCCIGQAGFGYDYDEELGWLIKDHKYGVVIGDDVEIGANTTIDGGSWRPTRVRDGAKIDNLVHLAHNVEVGERTLIIATAELSGSVTVGKRCWIAPGAVIHQRLKVGDGATVGLGAVVIRDVEEMAVVVGNPAKPIESDHARNRGAG